MENDNYTSKICDICGEHEVAMECRKCQEQLCSFCVFKKKSVCEFYGSCRECDWVLSEEG